jgi:hypothetical protein
VYACCVLRVACMRVCEFAGGVGLGAHGITSCVGRWSLVAGLLRIVVIHKKRDDLKKDGHELTRIDTNF